MGRVATGCGLDRRRIAASVALDDDGRAAFQLDEHGSKIGAGVATRNFKGKMMIERYGEVSDGKLFHAIQRDTNGQWVRYDDHAQELENQRQQFVNLIANRCQTFGVSLPVGLTFNAAIENLIKAVQSAEQERSADVTVRLQIGRAHV